MRLKVNKSKNSINYYIITDTKTKDGKRTTKVFKKLGNEQEILKISNGESPLEWAKKQVDIVNKQIEEKTLKITAEFSQSNLIEENKQLSFNCGYLFLQDIYYSLGLDKICNVISDKYRIKYNLNSILSNLIYTRIIEPSSKLSAFETAKTFLEQPDFELQNIYRALGIIANETENIESAVYKNSLNVVNRNTKILYYDCTNYFFEIEEAEGIKQYGKSKENRPLPIVQMGLFMDGDGFPLAFVIDSGNTNEQVTLKPLEKQIIKDFELSKFVVCTDAGLASIENRKFNEVQDRLRELDQQAQDSVSYCKYWLFIFIEVVCSLFILSAIALTVFHCVHPNYDFGAYGHVLSGVSIISLVILLLRIKDMYIFSPIISKHKIEKEQLNDWIEHNGEYIKLLKRKNELEKNLDAVRII